jgi:hypothetical protein
MTPSSEKNNLVPPKPMNRNMELKKIIKGTRSEPIDLMMFFLAR